MAPLTRMRATNPERAPTALHAQYYAQRATAGLIISEGTFVSPASVGWARVPECSATFAGCIAAT